MSLSFSSAFSISGDRAGFEVSSVGLPSVTARSFSLEIRGPRGSEACGLRRRSLGPPGRREDLSAGQRRGLPPRLPEVLAAPEPRLPLAPFLPAAPEFESVPFDPPDPPPSFARSAFGATALFRGRSPALRGRAGMSALPEPDFCAPDPLAFGVPAPSEPPEPEPEAAGFWAAPPPEGEVGEPEPFRALRDWRFGCCRTTGLG